MTVTMRLTLEIGLPPAKLYPNRSKGHYWTWNYNEKTAYQQEVKLVAKSAMRSLWATFRQGDPGFPWPRVRISYTRYWPKGQRRPDSDNWHTAMKPALDILTARHKEGVGLVVDDGPGYVELGPIEDNRLAIRHYHGHVIVTVERLG